ncbi:MAG: PF00070 family, FAD-dependent NAD(P)-disulphide oxidoreductase [uncultured Cytophagales bacterium]|uniref:PF00070 family, FAD-dependent NAD(P)-disulphide oxidoreductase n=1 Tax=uncultured Cytophagales bacterium TaxID=158755 RepID=A0A6J4H6M2_9SPHI|nr:MAG: PF00070 family, FAD-dependent NAD(P)-disulphide oxidoreductase [uncultured Cytophagales bacterium]
MEHYDAIIIGAGQAGVPLARKLAGAGWKTALIEKRWVGGTCINDGCTPTKTLIASARMAYLASRSADWGVPVEGYRVDMPAVKRRKDGMVNDFRNGSQKRLENTPGLDLLFGNAAFSGPNTLTVHLNDGGRRELHGGKIFINTGTAPRIPDIPGIGDVPCLTSTTLLDLEGVPGHLVVLGGGYVAAELGQLYRRLGSRVTMLARGEALLAREDEDVSAALRTILEEEGLAVHTGAEVRRVEAGAGGGVKLHVQLGGEMREIAGTHLLAATGRTPLTAGLNLPATGLIPGPEGYLSVNERLETEVPGIYALGDVNGGPAFTHVAYHDYVIVAKNLLEGASLSTTGRLVPYCVYTDPQLGRVGLSEREARARGCRVKIAKMPMTHVARALETGETRGFMKAVVDADSHLILGAAVLGADGGEIMSVLQVAMLGGLPYQTLQFGVFAHPTFAESLNNLFAGIK